MRDEEYLFHQDVREKKVTGYSARKQRSHCGKAGCKLPSDYLTKKEIKNMSGECRTYRLNEPMSWYEFLAMPDDIKVAYIMAIREKYNAPNVAIAKMMAVDKDKLWRFLKKLGIANGTPGPKKWDKDGFMEWCYGVPKTEEPVAEEITDEEENEILEILGETVEEETPVVECPYKEIPNPGIKVNLIKEEDSSSINFAIPASGTLTFQGTACEIMNTINRLLGNAKVAMEVQWTALED